MEKFLKLLSHDLSATVHRVSRLDTYEKLLALAVFIYILFFGWVSFFRHDNFYSSMFDLGNAVHLVWSAAQGKIPVSDGNYLLLFFTPFYILWPDPKLLLLLQTVILALGAVFVYKLSLAILHKRSVSFAFALAFLLNPSVGWVNFFGFHTIVFATTFLLGAFFFMKLKKYGTFLVFALLAGSCGPQVWLILGICGLFIVVRALYSLRVAKRSHARILRVELLFGLAFAFFSLSFFYVLTVVIIPGLTSNPLLFLQTFFSSPSEATGSFFEASRRAYLRQLFLPIGYLSIFSPLYLVFASPDIIMNLLSSNSSNRQIYYQYTATITPFIFVSAVYGVRLLRYFVPRIPFSFFTGFILISTLYCAYLYGPLPFSKSANTLLFAKRQNAAAISEYLKTIPDSATVSMSSQIGPHLSERKTTYILPEGAKEADYTIFLLNGTSASPSPQTPQSLSDVLRNSPGHILIFEKEDFLVFKRNRLSSRLY